MSLVGCYTFKHEHAGPPDIFNTVLHSLASLGASGALIYTKLQQHNVSEIGASPSAGPCARVMVVIVNMIKS